MSMFLFLFVLVFVFVLDVVLLFILLLFTSQPLLLSPLQPPVNKKEEVDEVEISKKCDSLSNKILQLAEIKSVRYQFHILMF